MQIIPGAQGQVHSNLLSAFSHSPQRIFHQVPEHARMRLRLTGSQSKCKGIPFLECVAATARRKRNLPSSQRNKGTWEPFVPAGVSGTIYTVQFTVRISHSKHKLPVPVMLRRNPRKNKNRGKNILVEFIKTIPFISNT